MIVEMRKYLADISEKADGGTGRIRNVGVWGPDDPGFADEGIHELLSELGYELVPGSEIWGTDEYCLLDESYLEYRIEFLEGDC